MSDPREREPADRARRASADATGAGGELGSGEAGRDAVQIREDEPPGFRAWFGQVEIPSLVPDRSAAFYQQVFGWSTREVASPAAPYISLTPAPGSPAGAGVTTPRTLGTTSPLAVIHVEGPDLATVLQRITAAGGRIDLPPTAVGDHGTFARFLDPDGNLLGLWASRPGG